ncbi:MAG: bifunctional pyr operon transcriptional regulator/uracil phosphoribosyltransferase PyrR [Thermorudis peleae]|nr:bifunctional pyr operon transcriptional regulator/uracil phosphoribosyltransferase PyrR [Thermorudis peleae]
MSSPEAARFEATLVLDAAGLAVTLDHLAAAIAAQFAGQRELALVGIRRRGDLLAQRLAERLAARLGFRPPIGALDITLYRDDFDSLAEQPIIGQTDIPFALHGKTIILVDDVLYTGRTVRAALDELLDLGRPTRIALAVLVDRGGRELPICPDFTGLQLPVAPHAQVQVLLAELDGRDAVEHLQPRESA